MPVVAGYLENEELLKGMVGRKEMKKVAEEGGGKGLKEEEDGKLRIRTREVGMEGLRRRNPALLGKERWALTKEARYRLVTSGLVITMLNM